MPDATVFYDGGQWHANADWLAGGEMLHEDHLTFLLTKLDQTAQKRIKWEPRNDNCGYESWLEGTRP